MSDDDDHEMWVRSTQELLRTSWKKMGIDPCPKMSNDATRLTAELFKIFVKEAIARASNEAMANDDSEVEPTHIENVMAGMLLDF